MSLRKKTDQQELAKQVLDYFLRNPHAADTLEGVARWRLLDETIHQAVEAIDRALEGLVSQGYLQQTATGCAGRIFCLNEGKRVEAERFLAEPESPEHARKLN